MKDYLSAVDGIIFLVDAADRTRFQEAQLTLETEEMETPTSKNMDEAKDGEGFALCRLCTSILFGMKCFQDQLWICEWSIYVLLQTIAWDSVALAPARHLRNAASNCWSQVSPSLAISLPPKHSVRQQRSWDDCWMILPWRKYLLPC